MNASKPSEPVLFHTLHPGKERLLQETPKLKKLKVITVYNVFWVATREGVQQTAARAPHEREKNTR